MFKNQRIVAIVPARGGSKGIPKKNIAIVNGKPLIEYTIHTALSSSYIDKVIVSTDSEEISNFSKTLGAHVPFYRPKDLASDQSKTIDSIIFTLSALRKRGMEYDYVVVLQPTQPLRKTWHIDRALEQLIGSSHDGLVSISKVKDHPILIRSLNTDSTVNNILDTSSTVRRQDFKDFYKVNGAIYINKISSLTSATSLNDNTLAFLMEEKYDLDIDDPLDLDILELILTKEEQI